MGNWSLRGQNRGASLVAVLIAMIFVMTIGGIVMNVTVTNIRMREAEASSKQNFYSAEEILDEITSGLNRSASEAMSQAYAGIMADYRNIVQSGSDLQAAFARAYLEKLTAVFRDPDKDVKVTTDPLDVGKVDYMWGHYDQKEMTSRWAQVRGYDRVEELTNSQDYTYLDHGEENLTFTADFSSGLFTLQNVKVSYRDDRGYATTISTDLVFHTPALNFQKSGSVMEYMKYALIADQGIRAAGVGNVNVKGSVYAGAEGIVTDHNSLPVTLTGSNIVTRGDIQVQPGSRLEIGTGSDRIWAENIVTLPLSTTEGGDPASLSIHGNCYVADDLTINGYNSTVTLRGSYYGYNFKESYTGSASGDGSSDFSSAMVLNGEGGRLDLSGLDYLMLAGRTFLSKGSGANSDIMLGESLSVRTNQLAYSVPERFLDLTKDPVVFQVDGAAGYAASAGVGDVSAYVDLGDPVMAYRYMENGVERRRYYLKFKGEQEANQFFTDYWNANTTRLSAYGDPYAVAIQIDGDTLFSLKGDILYRNAGDSLRERPVSISPGDWEPDGVYYVYADRLAVNYMALQMYLEDSYQGIDSSRIHFYKNGSAGEIDKTMDPLVENLIWTEEITENRSVTNAEGDTVNIVKNDGAGAYPVTAGRGVVVATGDVQVKGNFTGMIIAGGTIQFDNNVTVTADELLVAKLFAEDAAREEGPVFANLFKGYSIAGGSVVSTEQTSQYLTYENWTRTEE